MIRIPYSWLAGGYFWGLRPTNSCGHTETGPQFIVTCKRLEKPQDQSHNPLFSNCTNFCDWDDIPLVQNEENAVII